MPFEQMKFQKNIDAYSCDSYCSADLPQRHLHLPKYKNCFRIIFYFSKCCMKVEITTQMEKVSECVGVEKLIRLCLFKINRTALKVHF